MMEPFFAIKKIGDGINSEDFSWVCNPIILFILNRPKYVEKQFFLKNFRFNNQLSFTFLLHFIYLIRFLKLYFYVLSGFHYHLSLL